MFRALNFSDISITQFPNRAILIFSQGIFLTYYKNL